MGYGRDSWEEGQTDYFWHWYKTTSEMIKKYCEDNPNEAFGGIYKNNEKVKDLNGFDPLSNIQIESIFQKTRPDFICIEESFFIISTDKIIFYDWWTDA